MRAEPVYWTIETATQLLAHSLSIAPSAVAYEMANAVYNAGLVVGLGRLCPSVPSEKGRPLRCPTCTSPSPERHPAMQHGGEVQPCRDGWHQPESEKPDHHADKVRASAAEAERDAWKAAAEKAKRELSEAVEQATQAHRLIGVERDQTSAWKAAAEKARLEMSKLEETWCMRADLKELEGASVASERDDALESRKLAYDLAAKANAKYAREIQATRAAEAQLKAMRKILAEECPDEQPTLYKLRVIRQVAALSEPAQAPPAAPEV